jgi:hypothetical protein
MGWVEELERIGRIERKRQGGTNATLSYGNEALSVRI